MEIQDVRWITPGKNAAEKPSIHHRAYLSIGVTSSTGAGLCGVPGVGDSRGIGTVLCRILDMNFREFVFHERG